MSEKKEEKAVMHYNGIIDERFNEYLFRLWYCGKSYDELVKMFEGTPKEFCRMTLRRAIDRYKWHERRKRLGEKLEKEGDKLIVTFTKKRREILNHMIMIMGDEMDSYLQDPETREKPSWYPKKTSDLDTIFRLTEFMNNGGADRSQLDLKNSVDVDLKISDKTASKILHYLSENSTKKLLDPNAIDAEFEEIIDIEEMKNLEEEYAGSDSFDNGFEE